MRWPYPRIVAHRGGGALAPENTLAAIRLGASLGFRGVEFDVMLAGDGVPVLIHDETLERTTGIKRDVAASPYGELEKHGIPRFQDAARLCRELGLWANVEIKPARGHERATGETVARMASELWRGAPLQPVLSSFSAEALQAALLAAPDLPRGCLVDQIPHNWRGLDCMALHCKQEHLTEESAKAIKKAGYGLLCWTVNDPVAARRLFSWGVDCLVTDALGLIGPQFA
jgi:glycerophosphoryl diester phosphodiesterase